MFPNLLARLLRVTLVCSVVAATSCAAPPLQNPTSPAALLGDNPEQAAFQEAVEHLQSRPYGSHILFRLERPGKPPLEVAAGGALVGDRVALASISKSITAIGVALLIQQRKLTLDAKLGDILAGYFKQHDSALDPSLRDITIERVLTHRAGLYPNQMADQVNGLSSSDITSRVLGNRHFFSYWSISGKTTSNGSTEFVYSNLSYIVLGMVIEAISGQDYEQFCQDNVLHPAGVTDAIIPGRFHIVAPFGGWQMSLADVLKVWRILDAQHPSVLTRQTLDTTLLGHLGAPLDSAGHVYYTLGVYVRQDAPGKAYVLNHNGIGGFYSHSPADYIYVEKFVPGYAWAVAVTPAPSHGLPDLASEVRSMLKNLLAI